MYQTVESIRQHAVRFRRDRDESVRRELETMLNRLGREPTISVVRAFSYFSHLANIAEDLHHNRRRRAHRLAGSAPQEGSLALAFARLKSAGVGAGALRQTLTKALISPVLTAHPTEVQRKSILDCELEIRFSTMPCAHNRPWRWSITSARCMRLAPNCRFPWEW